MHRDAPNTGGLTIDIDHGRPESVLRVTGRVVIETSPQLRKALLALLDDRVAPLIIVDVSAVSYLDTSGIATLVEASHLAQARATRLRVTGLAGEPAMLAKVSEMDRIFAARACEVEFR